MWKYLEILMSQLLSLSQRDGNQVDIFQGERNYFCAQFFRVSWRDLENLETIHSRKGKAIKIFREKEENLKPRKSKITCKLSDMTYSQLSSIFIKSKKEGKEL